MAGANLLALIDKISVVLDDVALLTKVAAKKTAGVLGDDLALNAQQVSGVNADRELPVVFAVAKGSAVNKLILVPFAIAASAFTPWLIPPILMLGGLYLCFEGFEKVWHSFFSKQPTSKQPLSVEQTSKESSAANIVMLEQDKIKGAIRTDFVLSAEIIVIALGTVQTVSIFQQFIVVASVAALMTLGVYGLVAAIVKLDDLGLYLLRLGSYQKVHQTIKGKIQRFLGQSLLSFAPKLMKSLTFVGTIAMFLVGGSILVHSLDSLHYLLISIEQSIQHQTWLPSSLQNIAVMMTPFFFEIMIGLVSGALILTSIKLLKTLFNRKNR